ncbi:MAG TPA: HEPN domain-containing protein [Candidatus Wallbacteria bacterium]|nr:HEPN domain-containing protein [Candidatus Wallbacteria bacterium]
MEEIVKLTPEQMREIKKLLSSATIELRAAGINFFSPSPLLEDAIFHCQTSIEKSFMAFLIFKDVKFDKNDGFKKLCDYVKESDPDLSVICAQVSLMRPHPRNTTFKTDVEEAKAVIVTAEKVFQAIIERLPLHIFQK